MATLASALSYSRTQSQTDSNGLTDAKGIQFANEALLDFHRKLIAGGIDASQTREFYFNATPGVGQYTYPATMFWLKSLAINFTDNSDGYVTADQVDVSNLPGNTSPSWLRINQTTQRPLLDDRGDWYEIFPTPQVGATIRLFGFISPTEYTSTADTIAYPVSLDYRILGWRIASNYYYALNKFEEGDAFNTRYEERVKELIATLGRGQQKPLQATILNVGDNGWNF